jgi:hypothetical protein
MTVKTITVSAAHPTVAYSMGQIEPATGGLFLILCVVLAVIAIAVGLRFLRTSK